MTGRCARTACPTPDEGSFGGIGPAAVPSEGEFQVPIRGSEPVRHKARAPQGEPVTAVGLWRAEGPFLGRLVTHHTIHADTTLYIAWSLLVSHGAWET
jgi:hypothetical protein